MKYVGTAQYARLLDACGHYERYGFKYVTVPWAVSREAVMITRPPWVEVEPFSYKAGDELLYPVASAEQSFIQMQMDATIAGKPITGSYCAITPCFRNESVLDDLHQPYFLKLELISWDKATSDGLTSLLLLVHMVETARFIMSDLAGSDGFADVIENNDPDLIGVSQAYDIVTSTKRIELGSYGIREHAKVGRWMYGTGLAEPRYSYALETEGTGKFRS